MTDTDFIHTGQRGGFARPPRRTTAVWLRRSLYLPTHTWEEAEPWARDRMKIEAFRVEHPREVLSHMSAVIAHGLPSFAMPRVHVFDADRATTTTTGGTTRHASVNPREVVETELGPATSLIDTAIDIGRSLHRGLALGIWDAVVRRGVEPAQLQRRYRGQASKRGIRTLAWLTERTSPDAESVGESISRGLIEWFGYEEPDLQVTISTPDGTFRPDCLWEESKVIGEFDGYGKYGTDIQTLREEKRREDALRRAGYTVARWEYRDLLEPHRLNTILRQAGLRPTQPQVPALLRSFRNAAQRTHNPLRLR